MTARKKHIARLMMLAATGLLAACGGGDPGPDAASAEAGDDGRAIALKGGDCTGSCSGGGGTPVPGSNPLPTTAPAADILMRESFGPGPTGVRPKGGKGDLRSTFIGTTLGGFWVEWPGNKGNAWITGGGEATWKFTSSSSGGPNVNPYELPSPLEVGTVFGQVWADVTDGAPSGLPTALLPVALPTTAWAISIEGSVSPRPGSYIALGLTDSAVTLGNLATVSKVTLLFRQAPDGQTLQWELWQGGAVRRLLASGVGEDLSINQLQLSYQPLTQRLTPSLNGVAAAPVSLNLGAPRYLAFEGNGMADNLVLRKLDSVAR